MPSVSLHLRSRPENVALAREALAGLAETLALSREQYDDMRTAVTEACNNVVQHAYDSGDGPLEVDVLIVRDAVEVLVRDEGVGMAGLTEERAGELEIGLPVMLTLAERLQIGRRPQGGTEVQMRFAVPGTEALEECHPSSDVAYRPFEDPPAIVLPGFELSTRVSFSNGELAGAILPRVTTALAARAHFSADRISDVQIVSDAIAARAVSLAVGHLEVSLGASSRRLDSPEASLGAGSRRLDSPEASLGSGSRRLDSPEASLGAGSRRLDIQIGPLRPGGAKRLASDSPPPIERLVDELSTTATGPDEIVLLRMFDRA